MKVKLIVKISGLDHISEEELKVFEFENERDYYVDLLYTDPHLLLDGATFELVEEEE